MSYSARDSRKPRLLALRRRAAEIEGSRSENLAGIARARQSIGEALLRIDELASTRVNQAVEELSAVQSELFDLRERLRAAEDVLARTEVRAPRDGRIVQLRIHTSGGVIGPGDPLMDIVPSQDLMVINARIDPTDIDIVHAGLAAEVRLTPFSARSLAPLKGRVTSVSADRLIDEITGAPYYHARIELTEDPAIALDGATPYPGMPAEVIVVTGTRTALDYLISPLETTFRRALREQ